MLAIVALVEGGILRPKHLAYQWTLFTALRALFPAQTVSLRDDEFALLRLFLVVLRTQYGPSVLQLLRGDALPWDAVLNDVFDHVNVLAAHPASIARLSPPPRYTNGMLFNDLHLFLRALISSGTPLRVIGQGGCERYVVQLDEDGTVMNAHPRVDQSGLLLLGTSDPIPLDELPVFKNEMQAKEWIAELDFATSVSACLCASRFLVLIFVRFHFIGYCLSFCCLSLGIGLKSFDQTRAR